MFSLGFIWAHNFFREINSRTINVDSYTPKTQIHAFSNTWVNRYLSKVRNTLCPVYPLHLLPPGSLSVPLHLIPTLAVHPILLPLLLHPFFKMIPFLFLYLPAYVNYLKKISLLILAINFKTPQVLEDVYNDLLCARKWNSHAFLVLLDCSFTWLKVK